MKKELVLLFSIIFSVTRGSFSQDVTFNNLPSDCQLYPRNSQDSSEVSISGTVTTAGFDSMVLKIYRNDQLWKHSTAELTYDANSAPFAFNQKIHAEMTEYSFRLYLDTTLVAGRDSIVCGDVYLINGQSNALAIDYEGLATFQSEWLRSFGSSSQVAAQMSADLSWGLAQGHVYSTHAAVGVWGLRLGQMLVEESGIPICLLSGATGASYIADHLRNNSRPTDLNTNYGKLLYRTQQAKIQSGVKAIFWYQGEMNTDKTYSSYASNFNLLYTSWKLDFPGVEKIYLFQIRPTEGEKYQSQLREVQRQLAEQYDDVEIMSTCGVPGHDGTHYNYQGYNTIAARIFPLVIRDFYGSTDTLNITPPKIVNAFFSSDLMNELIIEFDQDVIWPAETIGISLRDYMFPGGGNTVTIDSAYVLQGNRVILHLTESSTAVNITYLPPKYYTGTSKIYQGPWLKNQRGITALSFFAYPISSVDVADDPSSADRPNGFVLEANYPNPFNSGTNFRYQLLKAAHVELTVCNSLGQTAAILVNENQSTGFYRLNWQTMDLPSGIYLYTLKVNDRYQSTRRMVLLK